MQWKLSAEPGSAVFLRFSSSIFPPPRYTLRKDQYILVFLNTIPLNFHRMFPSTQFQSTSTVIQYWSQSVSASHVHSISSAKYNSMTKWECEEGRNHLPEESSALHVQPRNAPGRQCLGRGFATWSRAGQRRGRCPARQCLVTAQSWHRGEQTSWQGPGLSSRQPARRLPAYKHRPVSTACSTTPLLCSLAVFTAISRWTGVRRFYYIIFGSALLQPALSVCVCLRAFNWSGGWWKWWWQLEL